MKIWFQNRRAKERKVKKKEEGFQSTSKIEPESPPAIPHQMALQSPMLSMAVHHQSMQQTQNHYDIKPSQSPPTQSGPPGHPHHQILLPVSSAHSHSNSPLHITKCEKDFWRNKNVTFSYPPKTRYIGLSYIVEKKQRKWQEFVLLTLNISTYRLHTFPNCLQRFLVFVLCYHAHIYMCTVFVAAILFNDLREWTLMNSLIGVVIFRFIVLYPSLRVKSSGGAKGWGWGEGAVNVFVLHQKGSPYIFGPGQQYALLRHWWKVDQIATIEHLPDNMKWRRVNKNNCTLLYKGLCTCRRHCLNGLVGTGFAPRYRVQSRAGF